jgi:hypothetical protein
VQQVELLGYVVRVLEEQEITYLLVGSLASGVYGEPRLTQVNTSIIGRGNSI